MWGSLGHVGKCREECAADPKCVAINFDSNNWCFGCRITDFRNENAWGHGWKVEKVAASGCVSNLSPNVNNCPHAPRQHDGYYWDP
jgi:hypothetical protein